MTGGMIADTTLLVQLDIARDLKFYELMRWRTQTSNHRTVSPALATA
jgi:hypothetical protein